MLARLGPSLFGISVCGLLTFCHVLILLLFNIECCANCQMLSRQSVAASLGGPAEPRLQLKGSQPMMDVAAPDPGRTWRHSSWTADLFFEDADTARRGEARWYHPTRSTGEGEPIDQTHRQSRLSK